MGVNEHENRNDLARWGPGGWLPVLALWVLPAAVAGTALIFVPQRPWLLVVAGAAFIEMGAACVINAARCRRVHCYITGPFFLFLALTSLLAIAGPSGARPNMNIQLLLGLVLAPALIWLPERIAGRKYRTSSAPPAPSACQR
ncbi:MAG: hypothetical protein RQ826_13705 [Xanthomonadales bacterium]|nr:hypothetical protein [Xanthomonadales bacterium]